MRTKTYILRTLSFTLINQSINITASSSNKNNNIQSLGSVSLPASCECHEYTKDQLGNSDVPPLCLAFSCDCECDLTVNKCDYDCCCDLDCADATGSHSSSCENSGYQNQDVNNYVCYNKHSSPLTSLQKIERINPKFPIDVLETSILAEIQSTRQSQRQESNVMCISYYNTPSKGHFYYIDPTLIQNLQKSSTTQADNNERLYSYDVMNAMKQEQMKDNEGYQVDDSIPIVRYDTGTHSSSFAPDLSSLISFNNYFRLYQNDHDESTFIQPRRSSCDDSSSSNRLVYFGLDIPTTQYHSNSNKCVQSYNSFSDQISQSLCQVNFNIHSYISFLIASTPSSDKISNYISMTPTIIASDSSSTTTITHWNETSQMCQNAIQSVQYDIFYQNFEEDSDSSRQEHLGYTITKVNVYIDTADFQMNNTELTVEQTFSVFFSKDTNDADNDSSKDEAKLLPNIKKSGNPGYVQNAPILAATLIRTSNEIEDESSNDDSLSSANYEITTESQSQNSQNNNHNNRYLQIMSPGSREGGNCPIANEHESSNKRAGTLARFGQDQLVGCTLPIESMEQLKQFCLSGIERDNDDDAMTSDWIRITQSLTSQSIESSSAASSIEAGQERTMMIPRWFLQHDVTNNTTTTTSSSSLLLSNKVIGIYGNANTSNIQDWLPIWNLDLDGFLGNQSPPKAKVKVEWDSISSTCKNIPTHLSYQIYWTKVGSIKDPQAKIIQITSQFHVKEETSFLGRSKPGSIAFRTTVTWNYKAPEYYGNVMKKPPRLLPKLPSDVFYPFSTSSAASTSLESAVTKAVVLLGGVTFWLLVQIGI